MDLLLVWSNRALFCDFIFQNVQWEELLMRKTTPPFVPNIVSYLWITFFFVFFCFCYIINYYLLLNKKFFHLSVCDTTTL